MLPPILEIYVVWHPGDDVAGVEVADAVLGHFRGTTFSGLIGGAVEVYIRSASPNGSADEAPMAIPVVVAPPYGLDVPVYTAVILVAGTELAFAAGSPGGWRSYVERIAEARAAKPDQVVVFPVQVAPTALDGTHLGDVVGGFQQAAAGAWGQAGFGVALCRDVAQGIAQLVDPSHEVLQVFVSHTKRADAGDDDAHLHLLERVRKTIADTRLREFFDARDLQPGQDWAPRLIEEAARSALLAVRTDRYSSRPWCQREVLTAKQQGMPVVVLDGLLVGEDRGSFLMDHVPRIAGHRGADGLSEHAIRMALNQLVDECLKRALWRAQERHAAGRVLVDVDWWAPHAPEPATFVHWLQAVDRSAKGSEPTVVLYPDPPLGPDEVDVLTQIGHLAGLTGPMHFLTPRGLAVRGG